MQHSTFEELPDVNLTAHDKEYWKSVELPNGVVVDISKDGGIISIEILWASKLFFGDVKKVIETAMAVTE